MLLRTSPIRLVAVLVLIWMAFVAVDMTLQRIENDRRGRIDYFVHEKIVEPEPGVRYPSWLFEEMRARFDIDREGSIPTWYASALLLVCSMLAYTTAGNSARAGKDFRLHWYLLAFLFLVMSVDEVARLHELLGGRLGSPGTELMWDWGLVGKVYFDWVLPVAILVIIVVVLYLPLFFFLPWQLKLLLALGAIAYVGGALGLETMSGSYVIEHGQDTLAYHEISVVEESLEILGLLFASFGLLWYTQYLAARRRASPAGEVPAPVIHPAAVSPVPIASGETPPAAPRPRTRRPKAAAGH
jgi:hypothetical protein